MYDTHKKKQKKRDGYSTIISAIIHHTTINSSQPLTTPHNPLVIFTGAGKK